jgi:hypothetical protein
LKGNEQKSFSRWKKKRTSAPDRKYSMLKCGQITKRIVFRIYLEWRAIKDKLVCML